MRTRTYLVVAGVVLGFVGLDLVVIGGCPFFVLFPPILVGTPCELSQTGSIGLILSVAGGALVIAAEIAQRLKSAKTDQEPSSDSDEDNEKRLVRIGRDQALSSLRRLFTIIEPSSEKIINGNTKSLLSLPSSGNVAVPYHAAKSAIAR